MKTAVALIVKNEERRLAEWLAHHAAVGFDTLLVYDNASTDGTRDIARSFGGVLDVRLSDWPSTDPRYQILAYEDIIRRYATEFDWIAFVDSDEFIVSDSDEPLTALLERAGDAAAVTLNWAIYGSSGHDAEPDALVTRTFLRRAYENFPPNRHVKLVVRPGRTSGVVTPHQFAVDGDYVDATGKLVALEPGGLTPGTALMSPWRVNHYFVKSRAQWRAKMTRGYHDILRAADEFAAYDRNEVFDDAALRWSERTRRLLRSPGEPTTPA